MRLCKTIGDVERCKDGREWIEDRERRDVRKCVELKNKKRRRRRGYLIGQLRFEDKKHDTVTV